MLRTGKQDGQTLVWFAIVLLVLLLSLALAIDIGNIYAERRKMQNAADAGALAGARELCIGNGPDAATAQATEYCVNRNGAQEADVTVAGNTVRVVASEDAPMYLGGLVGLPTVNVSAVAAAACGVATSACGLWPLTFEAARWDQLLIEEGCPQVFYVWNDDKIIDCDVYNCDLDEDGDDDIVVGGDRGWLDLSAVAAEPYTDTCLQPGCGESELECLIRRDSAARVQLPTCISGDSGVKAGVKDGVDSRINDTVGVPLFDSIGCSGPSENCPGGLTYRVSRIGCITVLGWENNLKLDALPPNNGTVVGKAIRARINCDQDCMSNCGATEGAPGEPWELKAVSLIE